MVEEEKGCAILKFELKIKRGDFMGANTQGLVSGNMKLLIKALDKISKNKGLTYEIDKTSTSEKHFFIHLFPIKRSLFVVQLDNLDEYKSLLPKHSRKMKNAKTGLLLSLGCNTQAQDFMLQLIQCHDSFGYIQLNDCNIGGFIEVDEKGMVMDNLKKLKNPQLITMTKYANGFPVDIPIIRVSEANKLNPSNISRIYVSINPKVTEGEVTSQKYLSDYFILSKDFDLPLKVKNVELFSVKRNHIVSNITAFDLLNKVPNGCIVNTYNKDLRELLPL